MELLRRYLKSNKIKKGRQKYPEMDALIVKNIKNGKITARNGPPGPTPHGMCLAGNTQTLRRGKLPLDKSYERAVDNGADSAPYKKTAAFRKWITEHDMDTLLANAPQKVRDKLLYELTNRDSHSALKKKHS